MPMGRRRMGGKVRPEAADAAGHGQSHEQGQGGGDQGAGHGSGGAVDIAIWVPFHGSEKADAEFRDGGPAAYAEGHQHPSQGGQKRGSGAEAETLEHRLPDRAARGGASPQRDIGGRGLCCRHGAYCVKEGGWAREIRRSDEAPAETIGFLWTGSPSGPTTFNQDLRTRAFTPSGRNMSRASAAGLPFL